MESTVKARKCNTNLSSDRRSLWRRCLISPFVPLVYVFLEILVLAAAQQPGFKSVDCGSSDSYTDPKTKVEWVPDQDFISTGQNVDLLPVGGGLDWQAIVTATTTQLRSLRRFPEKQSKHCYTFDGVVDKSQYLIRATFYHPNTSTEMGPLNHTISFSISIDSTVVEDLEFTPDMAETRYAKEYIIQARSDTMYVCLIPGEAVPFINALELRPLATDMYLSAYEDVRAFLVLGWRMDCGVLSTDETIRFPDDEYDRYWDPPLSVFDSSWNDSIISFDPSSKPKNWDWGQMGWNNPPNTAVNTAWDFRLRDSVTFSMRFGHKNAYFALYTVNLNASDNTPENTRDMSWYIDDKFVTNVSLNNGFGWQLYATNWTVDKTTPKFKLNKTDESVLGPIINAAEAYGVYLVNDVSTHPDDASAVKSLKSAFEVLKTYSGDPCLPVPYDWLNCITTNDSTAARIITLNLNDMQLRGEIPKAISDLTALETLRLDGNQLTGQIPDFSTLRKLQSLHLENNKFTGKIPSGLGNLPLLRELNLGNNSLCNEIPASVLRITIVKFSNVTGDCSTPKPISVGAIIGEVLGACAAIALVLFLLILCIRRRRAARHQRRDINPALGLKQGSHSLIESLESPIAGSDHISGTISFPSSSGTAKGSSVGSLSAGPRTTTAFSYAEIQVMSNNFAELIGRGGYGPVYRGRLPNGQEVAIKLNEQKSDQGTTEFVNEVELLSRVHHKNILNLTGYCAESPHKILVYQYMSNGTLHQHLHEFDDKQIFPLKWSTRVQIAQSAARGLDYLHTYALPKICHRDVKSSNILLDDDLSSKVGDFGISKSRRTDDVPGQTLNHGLTTDVKGSRGYMDPEYFYSQRLTYASDVYSFGVVLFEIITGKQPNHFLNLVEWARKNIREGNLGAIVDPVILKSGKYASEEQSLWRVAELAMLCTQERGTLRPSMSEVAQELTETMRVKSPSDRAAETLHSDSYHRKLVPILDGDQATTTNQFHPSMYEVGH